MHLAPSPPATISHEAIVYGDIDGYPLTLDLILPSNGGDSPRPAIILLHGGGWVFGISGVQDMRDAAAQFAKAGCVAATVEYRRTREPGHAWTWPDPFHDCQTAVRWLRTHASHYAIDPDCIIAYGHSAGGHLAAMLAVRDNAPGEPGPSSRVNGSIALAGHMDLRIPYTDEFAISSLRDLLGGAPDAVPDRTLDASPITWVDGQSAPFLMLYGHADHQVAPTHHRTMAAALQQAGTATTVVEVPDADHFTIADWRCAGPWALAFVSATATRTYQEHPPS